MMPRTTATERHGDGDIIFNQGEIGDRMYAVVSGTVRIFRTNGSGEKFLADLGEGEIFGELALFDNRPRSASARSIGDTELEVLTREEFLSMRCDATIRGMLVVLARRLRMIDDALETAGALQAPKPEGLAALRQARDRLV